jgi:hypothetical protein
MYYLAVSWRRWPDPLIDFGRELYLAWRISQGAVLYRDVDNLFGPLSQYINATIFVLFGPGIMHLVWANLLVFAAILVTLYYLLRQAWGPLAAFVACAIFVSVFGFSHFVYYSGYTYAAPYSHESTHGLLVLLLLLAVLGRWLEERLRLWEFSAGILFGLSAVLKVEIMFAALLLTMAAVALSWQRAARIRIASAATWAAGAVLPTLLFFGYFTRRLPLQDAWIAACHAWIGFTTVSSMATDPSQVQFLGFDRTTDNLIQHIKTTFLALASIASILSIGKIADRETSPLLGVAIKVATVVAALAIAWWVVPWIGIGHCLLGLTLLYLMRCSVTVVSHREPEPNKALSLRILFAVLAAALLARMMLNGRIYQYGFYQAAVASTVVTAVLLGESADWVRAARRGRQVIAAGFLSLLVVGVLKLTALSQQTWILKTYPVSQNADRFYTFPPDLSPAGETVHQLLEELSQQRRDSTLLVLPEGLMLNYLARLRSPLAPFFCFSVYTENGREAQLVDQLRRQPPALVVLVTRDLREFGIHRYGESVGKGQLLLQWVSANYTVVRQIGGDPLDFHQVGAIVFRKNRPLETSTLSTVR